MCISIYERKLILLLSVSSLLDTLSRLRLSLMGDSYRGELNIEMRYRMEEAANLLCFCNKKPQLDRNLTKDKKSQFLSVDWSYKLNSLLLQLGS